MTNIFPSKEENTFGIKWNELPFCDGRLPESCRWFQLGRHRHKMYAACTATAAAIATAAEESRVHCCRCNRCLLLNCFPLSWPQFSWLRALNLAEWRILIIIISGICVPHSRHLTRHLSTRDSSLFTSLSPHCWVNQINLGTQLLLITQWLSVYIHLCTGDICFAPCLIPCSFLCVLWANTFFPAFWKPELPLIACNSHLEVSRILCKSEHCFCSSLHWQLI